MRDLRLQAAAARLVPERLRRRLTIRGLIVNLYAWRAGSTSAVWFARVCAESGLSCVAQEKIAWEYGRFLTDVITTVTPRGSIWERPCVAVRNRSFMHEARAAADVGLLYSCQSFPRKAT